MRGAGQALRTTRDQPPGAQALRTGKFRFSSQILRVSSFRASFWGLERRGKGTVVGRAAGAIRNQTGEVRNAGRTWEKLEFGPQEQKTRQGQDGCQEKREIPRNKKSRTP